MADESGRVMLWCTPRSVSTAFTKCISAIEGIEVWFELFVQGKLVIKAYNRLTGKDLPATYEGNEEAYDMAAAEVSRGFSGTKLEPERIAYANVKRNLEQTTSRYVFAKDVSISMASKDSRRYLPTGYRHAFLIRHPAKVFTSYRKAVYQQLLKNGSLHGDARVPEKFDIERDDYFVPSTFFQDHHSLWKYIQDSGIEPEPVVLDIDDLLANPAEMLPKFCRAVGLPYSESLLTWETSVDVMDNWKAANDTFCRDIANFFATVMESGSFFPPKEPLPRDQLYADVIRLSDASMPFYEELRQHKI